MRRLSLLLGIGTIILIAVLVIVLYLYSVNSSYFITVAEARQRLKQNKFDVVLDVRTEVERNTLGFYPTSRNIPGTDLEQEIPRQYIDKQTRFLVYCNTGQRARAATEKLIAMGYTNVRYIAGSYRGLL